MIHVQTTRPSRAFANLGSLGVSCWAKNVSFQEPCRLKDGQPSPEFHGPLPGETQCVTIPMAEWSS